MRRVDLRGENSTCSTDRNQRNLYTIEHNLLRLEYHNLLHMHMH